MKESRLSPKDTVPELPDSVFDDIRAMSLIFDSVSAEIPVLQSRLKRRLTICEQVQRFFHKFFKKLNGFTIQRVLEKKDFSDIKFTRPKCLFDDEPRDQ